MSETLVERMGHAIGTAAIEAAKRSDETPWETIALAVLRAIREPSPAMLRVDGGLTSHGVKLYQAIIDAAIAEAGGQEPQA